MSNFDRRKPQQPQFVANERIRYPEVRVSTDTDNLGILKTSDAIWHAKNMGLDLVLVTENAAPPVCKIVDLNKFLYQQKQKAKEAAKNSVKVASKSKRFNFAPTLIIMTSKQNANMFSVLLKKETM